MLDIQGFYENGIAIVDNENIVNWHFFNSHVRDLIGEMELNKIHKSYQGENINNIRLKVIESLNKLEGWEEKYFSMASSALDALLGKDMVVQKTLNFNIQTPNDVNSILEMHKDTFAGESPFEVIVWVPLTKAYGTNGLYYFDKEVSKKITNELTLQESKGISYLREKYYDQRKEINVDENSVVIFSSTIFHGNILNSTIDTRVSLNCRAKNLFHPDGSRELGYFYRVFKLGSIAKIGIEYSDERLKFN